MEQLTKDELIVLTNLLANAQVKVGEAQKAIELLDKLKRMIEQEEKCQPSVK